MDQETSSKWLLQPVEEWSGNKQPVTSVLLGILVCSGAIMILLHGIGLGSWSSAAVLICPLVGLVAVGHFRNTIWDSVFLLFVLWLGISTVVNGPGPLKEEILFILTLAAYPAARLSGTTGRPFFAVLGLVGFLGLVCIVVALRDQWSDLHGNHWSSALLMPLRPGSSAGWSRRLTPQSLMVGYRLHMCRRGICHLGGVTPAFFVCGAAVHVSLRSCYLSPHPN